MKLGKKVMIAVLFGMAVSSWAGHNCTIVPDQVHLGTAGAMADKVLVCKNGVACYNLGVYSTERAKQMYAMSLTAVSTGKSLTIGFGSTPCSSVTTTDVAGTMGIY